MEDTYPSGNMTDVSENSEISVGKRISELMTRNGIPSHQQVAFIARLCGLSTSQARRKLHGTSWSFAEAYMVARHFDVSLDSLAEGVSESSAAMIGEGQWPTGIDAFFLVGEARLPCKVKLGPRGVCPPALGEIVAVQAGDNLLVSESRMLAEFALQGQFYLVEEVVIYSPERHSPHIAILDDDPESSSALRDWFVEAGYGATAFTSGRALFEGDLAEYDAYIIDFLLAGGDSSRDVITAIRQRFPDAPIALLTGKLRDGLVSEGDLAPLLRTMNVTFFEKPVRPAVLAASLQNGLDQVALKQAAGLK